MGWDRLALDRAVPPARLAQLPVDNVVHGLKQEISAITDELDAEAVDNETPLRGLAGRWMLRLAPTSDDLLLDQRREHVMRWFGFRSLHGFRSHGEVREIYEPIVQRLRERSHATAALENAWREGRSNLPAPWAGLRGRRDAIRDLATEVRSERLTTIIGPPGVGKTALALEVARRSAALFPGGLWWADLRSLSAEDDLDRQLCTILGIGERTDEAPRQRIIEALRGDRTLIVLDNCEHVIDECNQLVHDLLAGSRDAVVLATSQQRLAHGRAWPLPRLSEVS